MTEVRSLPGGIIRLHYEKHLELFLKVYETQKNNLDNGSGLGSLLLSAAERTKPT